MDIVSKEISIEAEGFSDIQDITAHIKHFVERVVSKKESFMFFLLAQQLLYRQSNLNPLWYKI
jgi:hypothetical protein